MSAPGAPSSFTKAFTGFVDHPSRQPSFAALFTWVRSAGPPVPIEHYEINLTEPDNVISDGLGGYIHEFTHASTADEATRYLLDSDDLLTPQAIVNLTDHDGDEAIKIKARNSDGSSSQVTINNWMTGYATRPLSSVELAVATGINFTSVGTTTAQVNWSPTSIATLATHWVVKLYRGAVLEREFETPFYNSTFFMTGLVPGTSYGVKVFARYRSSYNGGLLDGQLDSPTAYDFATSPEGASAMTGPVSVDLKVGGLFTGTFSSPVTDTIYWNVVDGPPGVTVTGRELAPYLGDLSGQATEAGIFDATVETVGKIGDDGAHVRNTLPVRFRVGSAVFHTWFHDDPLRSEIQIDVRTGTISSATFDITNGVALALNRLRKIHVLFRDKGIVLDTVPTAIRLVVKPVDQFDAETFLKVDWNDTDVETIGGADRAFITITPGGDDVEGIFATLNNAEDSQAGSAQIEGRLEVTYTFDGVTRTTTPAKSFITQNYNQ